MSRIIAILKLWIPLAVVITLLSGLVYGVAQQVLRQGANDPQIQMAEDAARSLAAGNSVASVVPGGQIEISSSLAPFVIVFDEAGKPTAGSGELHGNLPTLPPGVFEYLRSSPEDRITWQPEEGVRMASVVTRVTGGAGGFVLAGRSLRETERRESQMLGLATLGGIGTLLATLVAIAAVEFLFGLPWTMEKARVQTIRNPAASTPRAF